MYSTQFENVIKLYNQERKRYEIYPQLFNKALKFYDILPYHIECLRKYYALDSEILDNFINHITDYQLHMEANALHEYWDRATRKYHTDRINKYIGFYILDMPLNERPIELSYLTPRVAKMLKLGGIKTIGELLNVPNIEMLRDINGIGGVAIRRIKEFLEDINRNSNE